MNAREINKILTAFDKKHEIFKGVFPSDKLPKKIFKQFPVALVVNLDTSKGKGSHWIAIYIDEKRKGYYFDSYGCKPEVKQIQMFMRNQCKQQFYFEMQLQSSNSNVCGGYAIVFLIFKMDKYSNYQGKKFEDFFTTNTFINDLCINRIIKEMKQKIVYH